MENIPRNLERYVNLPKPPKPAKKARRWNLLLVGNHGKIIPVSNFRILAATSVLVFALAAIAAVCFYSLYKSATDENRNLANALEVSRKRIISLQSEKKALAPLEVTEPMLDANVPATEQKVIEKPLRGTILPAEKPYTVEIEDFLIFHEKHRNMLRVQFKLIHTGSTPSPVSGFTCVILKNNENKPNKWLVLPSVALVEGKPFGKVKGQAFSISHFKTVKFKAKNQTAPDRFQKASVFIFASDGQLLLEKNFPVEIKPA